ncbi:MAG: DUF4878 domain-containing protein [Zoogloeaceae bacterium]|jgi:hypothetical protein|nr:DUF4878 domain-containing protein [Zoogloeaceae bacterium]
MPSEKPFENLYKLGVLLGAAFAVALLPACSESPEAAVENLRKTVLEGRSESPERVVEKATKAMSEGRVGEAFLKYGSNAMIEEMPQKRWSINKQMARPATECLLVRQCAREEWETILIMGGASEKTLLELKRDWHKFDSEMQEAKRVMRERISSDLQKKGGLVSIATTLVSQTEDTAQVSTEMRYGNGSSDSELITLVKESGEWKMK